MPTDKGSTDLAVKGIEAGAQIIGNIFATINRGQIAGPGTQPPTIVRQERETNLGVIIFVGLFFLVGMIIIIKK